MCVKIAFASPSFFSTNPKRIQIEENPGAGRVYFLVKGRIVAVGIPTT